jgi:hypothetical protein
MQISKENGKSRCLFYIYKKIMKERKNLAKKTIKKTTKGKTKI